MIFQYVVGSCNVNPANLIIYLNWTSILSGSTQIYRVWIGADLRMDINWGVVQEIGVRAQVLDIILGLIVNITDEPTWLAFKTSKSSHVCTPFFEHLQLFMNMSIFYSSSKISQGLFSHENLNFVTVGCSQIWSIWSVLISYMCIKAIYITGGGLSKTLW